MMTPSNTSAALTLPATLIELAAARKSEFRAAAGPRSDVSALDDDRDRVWAFSEFVAQACIRHPAMLDDLVQTGDIGRPYHVDAYPERVAAAIAPVNSEDELMRALRALRRREMVRIAWRDLAGYADLDETVRDTSAFADAVLGGALETLHRWQCRDLGEPASAGGEAQALVVIAMGKLGAEELNFSSDIDLIFAYPEPGETRGGARALSNEQFFVRLARRLIHVLSHVTEDGFVFRVDMRLRPFGDSGPLVASFDAIEGYYETHGRDWERYAMIRARAAAGDTIKGHALLERLRPFVYRRYLDFGAIEALRDMKALINQEVKLKDLEDNVKRGPGGIREIEFIGQAFQMIRGGREAEFRQRQILGVLSLLRTRGQLPEGAAEELSDAYRFMRNTEHRLQMLEDRQTHALPKDPLARQRVSAAMGFADWEELSHAIGVHRARVQHHFDRVFARPSDTPNSGPVSDSSLWDVMVDPALDANERATALAELGFEDPLGVWDQIVKLRESRNMRVLGPRGAERFRRLMPSLLRAVAESADPVAALPRTLAIMENVARRSVYLALLIEHPDALAQLVKLCAASPWIAQEIARHPLLLDELLDPRTLYAPQSRPALETDIGARLGNVADGDTEQEMDCLRHFKQASVLRVAAADVADAVPLMVVSDYLTEIAEVTLAKTLELVWRDLVKRYGRPRCRRDGQWIEPKFVIIAYGKLGGIELGYGSDLDLVFLHGNGGTEQYTDGDKSVDNSVFFGRLGQRIIHFLNARTAAGMLYEVDSRLRPSGSSGLLVSSIEALETYQHEQAWTWEHQALVRARPVAGDEDLGERFKSIRRDILLAPRNPETLRREVREMRGRMREELADRRPDAFDLKQAPGGIADIEFMVQYGALRWGARLGDYLDFSDNIRLLEGFAATGFIAPDDANLLADAYRAYRSRVHTLALEEQPAVVTDGEFSQIRDEVARIWKTLMEE